jgi:hypothetical protein
VKLKKTNFLLFLSKGKHRWISPPLGILLDNCHYVIVACAFTLLVENSLVVLYLADRTPVEVEWQTPLVRFRAFYTLVHERNVENLNS